jgi:hypothetical protein
MIFITDDLRHSDALKGVCPELVLHRKISITILQAG